MPVATDWRKAYRRLVLSEPEPGLLEIVLSNPGRLNSVDAETHTELTRIWRDIDGDHDISVVLVRGEGSAFSAGGDFDLVEAIMRDEATRIRVWKEARDLVYNVINCSKPVVSAIEGPAVGAGLAGALLGDISVGGRSARLVGGHTPPGVAPRDHAALVWPPPVLSLLTILRCRGSTPC